MRDLETWSSADASEWDDFSRYDVLLMLSQRRQSNAADVKTVICFSGLKGFDILHESCAFC